MLISTMSPCLKLLSICNWVTGLFQLMRNLVITIVPCMQVDGHFFGKAPKLAGSTDRLSSVKLKAVFLLCQAHDDGVD